MTVRTPEAIRQLAHEHYRAMKDWNCRMQKMLPAAAEEEEQFCKVLLEAVLATPEGQLFGVEAWIQAQGYEERAFGKVFSAAPYMKGTLKLLEMEFAHATLGVFPLEEVRAVLENETPRVYQGVELTGANVFIQFRRLPL